MKPTIPTSLLLLSLACSTHAVGADLPASEPIMPPRAGPYESIDFSHAENFDGWDADPTYWTVKDGVFTAKGEKVPSTFLLRP
jgi:hypothetical protein